MKVEPGAGHRDGRADVEAFGDLALEGVGDEVAPGVERDDALLGSDHCGNGPMVAAGWVLVRSGRRIGSSAPEVTASAR